ncbi:MAG: DUF3109 family protein [Bacteroidota bacterium]
MLIIQDKLISRDIVEQHFVCQLSACKGACCWEGDYGAPLEEEELKILDSIYEEVKPFLTKEGIEVIEKEGTYTYYKKPQEFGTPLIANGACVYLTRDEEGISKCGIEEAYNAGHIDFKKPISCHLYPIRVSSNKAVNFEALNYDRWDICSAACSAGRRAQIPIYQFAREALIRKYGHDFYDELHAAASHLTADDQT